MNINGIGTLAEASRPDSVFWGGRLCGATVDRASVALCLERYSPYPTAYRDMSHVATSSPGLTTRHFVKNNSALRIYNSALRIYNSALCPRCRIGPPCVASRSRPNVACQSVLVPVYRPEEQPHTRRREGASEMLSTFVLIGQFPFKVLSIV